MWPPSCPLRLQARGVALQDIFENDRDVAPFLDSGAAVRGGAGHLPTPKRRRCWCSAGASWACLQGWRYAALHVGASSSQPLSVQDLQGPFGKACCRIVAMCGGACAVEQVLAASRFHRLKSGLLAWRKHRHSCGGCLSSHWLLDCVAAVWGKLWCMGALCCWTVTWCAL
jgi:hypothetical protein